MTISSGRDLKRNIPIFYLYNITTGIFFAVPVFVLFWQENGLNLTQVMLLQSIFSVFTVLLEVPTGYFADLFGRRNTLILAGIAGTLGIGIYSIGHNFYQFLAGEIFFAVHVSFTSGTKSAIIYETLRDLGKEEEFKKLWGNLIFTGMMALAASSVAGGIIADYSLRYTLFASIPFFFFPVVLSAAMKEPERHKLIVKKGYLKELLTILKKVMLHNRKLRWIILYAGVIYAFNQSALWLYQPYFTLTGLDITYFGIVFAAFQAVGALSSRYAWKLENILGQRFSLAMLLVLVGVSYILMSSFVFLFSFSFCFIQQFVRGFKNTVITDYINKLTDSDIRATVLSLQSFIGRLLYAVIVPFAGWISDAFTLTQALAVLGITALTASLSILPVLRRNRII